MKTQRSRFIVASTRSGPGVEHRTGRGSHLGADGVGVEL